MSCHPFSTTNHLLIQNHLVFGINFKIHFVSIISPVSKLLFMYFSSLFHGHYSQHSSLTHSFSPSSKPTFSTNPSTIADFWYSPNRLTDHLSGPHLIMLINLFSFIYVYLPFVSKWLPKLSSHQFFIAYVFLLVVNLSYIVVIMK